MLGDPTNGVTVVPPKRLSQAMIRWNTASVLACVHVVFDLVLAIPSVLTSIAACHLPLFNE